MLAGPLADADRQAFRAELDSLQTDLRNYMRLLGEKHEVVDIAQIGATAELAFDEPGERAEMAVRPEPRGEAPDRQAPRPAGGEEIVDLKE